MDDLLILATVLGLGGIFVVVYFTTELAGMFFGIDPLPQVLRRLAAFDRGQPSRIMRALPLVVLLVMAEGVIIGALVTGATSSNTLAQSLLVLQLVFSAGWTAWLTWLYRSHARNRRTRS